LLTALAGIAFLAAGSTATSGAERRFPQPERSAVEALSPEPPAGEADSSATPDPDALLSPETYFGHPTAADRLLTSYDEAVPYFEYLAGASERVGLRRLGKTTLGRDLLELVVTSPANMKRLDHYRDIARQLDDPRGRTESELSDLVREGKTVLMVTFNIHASEIVTSQMGFEWVYRLAADDGNGPARFLDDVILLLVPSLNPDGQVTVTDWYRRQLGTEYEGSDLPWLYHPYAGHDNNRDWYMLNLRETRLVNREIYHEWHPQVIVDVHQMGPNGPRIFLPPYADPLSDRVHPLVYREADLIGTDAALRLEQRRMSGAIYGYLFDTYWPGGVRSTPWWKNTAGVLVEIASADGATPVYIDPSELTGGQKGLSEYQPQVNFPHPWGGGWWRPRDILDYGLAACGSALETCAIYRKDFLQNRIQITEDIIARSGVDAPAAYVVPAVQHDPGAAARLVDLLREHGLEASVLTTPREQEGHSIPAGSVLFSTRQPYAAFLVEMMEPQTFRRVRPEPDSDAFHRPYDITAWTLPLLFGVETYRLENALTGSLRPLTVPAWDGAGWVSAEQPPTAGVPYALSPALTDSYTAAARLLARGASIRQALEPFRAANRAWPAGTFLVTATPSLVLESVAGLRTGGAPVSGDVIEVIAEPPGTDLPSRPLRLPRIGIYQPWLASIDEGWTRFVLDEAVFPYRILHNRDIRRGELQRSLDVIVLPDLTRKQLLTGYRTEAGRRRERPAPYDGGLDRAGLEALLDFVSEGGTLVTLGRSSDLAVEDFGLPVRDVNDGEGRRIRTPGTLLRVEVNRLDPLGFGMPRRAAVYHTSSPVFSTEPPAPGQQRSVVARFPASGDLLLSGWGNGVDELRRKAALVMVGFGKGKVVLFGFRPQYRGQTRGTFRFLFNTLLDAAAGRS